MSKKILKKKTNAFGTQQESQEALREAQIQKEIQQKKLKMTRQKEERAKSKFR